MKRHVLPDVFRINQLPNQGDVLICFLTNTGVDQSYANAESVTRYGGWVRLVEPNAPLF